MGGAGKWGEQPIYNFLTEAPLVVQLDIPQAVVERSQPQAAKLKQSQSDRVAIRAVAEQLWKLNPDLNIVEMIARPEIKKDHNGAQYAEKTIRGWIKDIDPRPPSKRVGRPPKKQ